MRKMIWLLLFLIGNGKALAFEFPIEISEYIDDIKIYAHIEKSDIDEKSEWMPFETSPPLSIFDALKSVQKYIDSNTNSVEQTLIGIELKQIPRHKEYWHYLVKVKYKIDDKLQPHFFIVLMDGKVISAIRRPDAIK